MKKILKITAYLIIFILLLAVGGYGYLKLAKPNVGRAPQLKVVMTPDRIERGRYLANCVAVCMDCHSTRDWSRYSGPITPGTLGKGGDKFPREFGFPGNFYARNITPFGLKDWTDGEIFRTITTGVDRKGNPIFPVMPYHYYGRADTEDIHSIIAYLRTLTPIEVKPPVSQPDFPFSLLMRTIPVKATPMHRPAPDDSIAYGRYLVNMASCIDCHTRADKKMNLIAGAEFGGGREFPLPGVILKSANITPDVTGIGNWDQAMFISRFKQYLQPGAIATGLTEKDNNTVMPWTMYAGMTEADLACIYQYLKTVKPVDNLVVKLTPKVASVQ